MRTFIFLVLVTVTNCKPSTSGSSGGVGGNIGNNNKIGTFDNKWTFFLDLSFGKC